MASYFQIRVNSPNPHRSFISPAAAAVRGIAMQESATVGTMELADGTKAIAGFLMRDTRATGPSVGELTVVDGVYMTSGTPALIPFLAGGQAALEDAIEVYAEGADMIDNVLATTPAKTELAFSGGKWHLATAGQVVEFVLNAVLTGSDLQDSANNTFGIIVTRCPAHLKS